MLVLATSEVNSQMHAVLPDSPAHTLLEAYQAANAQAIVYEAHG